MNEKTQQPPILVPIDFSAHSEAALLKACELSACSATPIVALHVVHDPAEMPGYYARFTKKKYLHRIEDMAKEMMEEFMRELQQNHPDIKQLKDIESMLVIGLPVTRILQVIEKIQPSMVVMGSKGISGLAHLLLGSVSEHVIRLCPCPVTIVKLKETAEPES